MHDTWGLAAPARATLPRWLAPALLALLASSGCSLDSRTLSMAPHTGGSGGTGPSSMPNSNGNHYEPPPEVELPVCVYDADPDPECASLVENAGFAEDVTGWAPEGGITRAWDNTNASSVAGSGSIAVENLLFGTTGGVAPGAAVQCVSVTPDKIYDLAADVFIAEGQGAGDEDDVMYEGKALLSVYFSNLANCAPPTTGNIFSEFVTEPGRWVHVEASGRAPEGAVSMAVRLDTLKPFQEYFFKAMFDNVFVRER